MSKHNELAQAIILQAMEDLWSKEHRLQSMRMFFGTEFKTLAVAAGLDPDETKHLLRMVLKACPMAFKYDLKEPSHHNGRQGDHLPLHPACPPSLHCGQDTAKPAKRRHASKFHLVPVLT